MMSGTIDEARMAAILAAYGADPARWPAAERAEALAWLAAHDGGLADAHAEARAVDAALDRDARGAAASESLTARVLQTLPRAGATVTLLRRPAPQARSWNGGAVAALAACAVIGVVIGFNASGYRDDSIADADAAFGAALGVNAERGDPGGGG